MYLHTAGGPRVRGEAAPERRQLGAGLLSNAIGILLLIIIMIIMIMIIIILIMVRMIVIMIVTIMID